MAEFNGKQGVWRTVGGRRIFIVDGEDLKTAMEKSGKFKDLKKENKEKNYKKIEKQLLEDYTKVDTEDLEMYKNIFKEQGKEKFANRLQNEIDKRTTKEVKNDKFLQKAVALNERDKGKISEEEYFNKLSEIDGLDPEKEKTRVRENLERLGVEVPDYLKNKNQKENKKTTKEVNDEYNKLSKKMQQDDYYYRPEDDRKLQELRAEYDTLVAKGQEDVNLSEYNEIKKQSKLENLQTQLDNETNIFKKGEIQEEIYMVRDDFKGTKEEYREHLQKEREKRERQYEKERLERQSLIREQRLRESSQKVKTQKGLKEMADDGLAKDITTYSDEETKKLRKKHGRLEVVKLTKGTYGMNGALLKSSETGEYFVITARNGNLFYWV